MSNSLGLLREIADDELPLMLEWRNSPEVRANMYTQHVISLDEHLAWWGRIKESSTHKYFMYEQAGIPLGIVGFVGVDLGNKKSSWAFYASRTAPRGTGSKMEYLALEFAFSQLGLNKLYCEVLAFNTAVIKLHQKFGFSVEGVLREQCLLERKFIDVYMLGLLAREWAGQRKLMLEKLSKI